MAEVTLREITADTVRQILDLEVAEDQRHLVAPNSVSIAEAYFEPMAWFRAIYADEEPVGFVMLFDDPNKPMYYLWRLMVDASHQRRGYGRRAVELLIDYVRTRPNASELLVSYVPGDRSPQALYAGLGFTETGEIHSGEVVMRLSL